MGNDCSPGTLAADLTFAVLRGGRVHSHMSDWDAEVPLKRGSRVLVADGSGGPWPATVLAVDADGTVALQIDPECLATPA